jgi:hypothetical protein
MDTPEERIEKLEKNLAEVEADRDYWRSMAVRVLQEINDAKAEILKLSTGKH